MKKVLFLLLVSIAFISFSGCQEAKPVPLNPNGDTELAILMREMFVDLEKAKKDMEEGKKVKLKLDHKKLLTAEATEPEKVATETYKSFAQMYLSAIDDLSANHSSSDNSYKSVVQACTSCHQALCPGPLVKIKHLEVR